MANLLRHPRRSRRRLIGSIAFLCVAFFLACSDDDSDFAVRPSNGSSSSVCEGCDDVSSSSTKRGDGVSLSSSSGQAPSAMTSSSSAKSSSSVTLATPCKTDSTDTCEYGELIDSRDDQIYRTVKIGDQWWMAENLNYETTRSYCYEKSVEYCTVYGRLYLWSAAMDSAGIWSENGKGCGYGITCSPTYPVRGVCPEGWHLPSRTEWENLFVAVGGSTNSGTVLKSTSVYSNTKPTDAYGFSALFSGIMLNNWTYEGEKRYVHFQSSTEYSDQKVCNLTFNNIYTFGIIDSDNEKDYGYSVRCIKDATE